ncbi:MAG: GSCFA domain-containing protein [Chitinophagaceae bacterium]
MQWSIPIQFNKPSSFIQYGEKILLIGSCFTEHIGKGLDDLQFETLQNPHGILFGPDAICKSISSYCENFRYKQADLFQLNEVWYSWDHHSRFSDTQPTLCLEKINNSQEQASHFIKDAHWLILTLGSSFCYRLTEKAMLASGSVGDRVANCHRAPADWFQKELLSVQEICDLLRKSFLAFKLVNPQGKIILTVSPVRHIRDGVQQNNRSKARLFEAIQLLEEEGLGFYYFPAYELVVDVLRDYRFYDIDLVHPNFAATEYVLEKFMETCMEEKTRELSKQVKKLMIAYRHRPQHPNTRQHQEFIEQQWQKAKTLQEEFPFLNLQEQLDYFAKGK